MHITFVKKIKADGSPCRKCAEVQERLEKSGYLPRIDRTVIADERDPASEGMQLAQRHSVEVAPFFIVEDGGATRIYTVYFRFVKEVLQGKTDSSEEIADIMDRQNLDFL